MASFQFRPVRNRVLNMLAPDDFDTLASTLERVPLAIQAVIITARQPIVHVYFLESGIVSTVANTDEGRIEVGLTGREGVVGLPAILGVDSTPHTSLIQGAGEALRLTVLDLRTALVARPAIFRPLGLFTHTLMIQLGQTAYANVAFSIEARLARWILMTQDRTDGDDLVLTHDFLAMMLGVRRPSVTVAMHALEGMRAIGASRGRVVVRNRGMLKDIAGDAYQLAEDEYDRVMTHAGQ